MDSTDNGDLAPAAIGVEVSAQGYQLSAVEITDDALVQLHTEEISWDAGESIPPLELLVSSLSRFASLLDTSRPVVAGLCYETRTAESVLHLTHVLRGLESIALEVTALETLTAARAGMVRYTNTDTWTSPAAGVAAEALRTATSSQPAARIEIERRINGLLKNRIADLLAVQGTLSDAPVSDTAGDESAVVQALRDHHRRELATNAARAEGVQQELQREVSRLQTELEQAPEHAAALVRTDTTVEALRAQVETLAAARRRSDELVVQLRDQVEEARSAVPEPLDAELQQQLEHADSELAASQAEIRVLRSELEQGRQSTEARVSELIERYQRDLQRVSEEHELEVVRATTSIQDRQRDTELRLQNVQERAEAVLGEERAGRVRAEQELRTRSDELSEAQLALQDHLIAHDTQLKDERATAAAASAAMEAQIEALQAEQRTRIGELEAALAEATEQRETEIDTLKRELNRTVVERRQIARTGEDAIRESDQSVAQLLDELRAEHQRDVEKLVATHRSDSARLATAHATQVEKLKTSHGAALRDSRQATEAELAGLRAEHNRTVSELSALHDRQLEAGRAEVASAQAATEELAARHRAEVDRAARDLQDRPDHATVTALREEIAGLQRTIAEQRTGLESATSAATASDELVTSQADELRELRAQLRSQDQNASARSSEAEQELLETQATLAARDRELDELRRRQVLDSAQSRSLTASTEELRASANELQTALEEATEREQQLRDKHEALVAAETEKAEEREQLQTEVAEQIAAVTSLNAQTEALKQDLELAHRRNRRLSDELEQTEGRSVEVGATLDRREQELAAVQVSFGELEADRDRWAEMANTREAELERMEPPEELISALKVRDADLSAAVARSADLENEVIASRRRAQALAREGNTLRSELAGLDSVRRRAEAALTRHNETLASSHESSTAEVRTLEEVVEALTNELSERKRANEVLESDLAAARDHLATRSEALSQELETTQTTLKAAQQELSDVRETAEADLAAAREQAQTELAETKEAAQTELTAAREQAQVELAATKQAAQSELAAARQKAQVELAASNAAAKAELTNASEDAHSKLTETRRTLHELRTELETSQLRSAAEAARVEELEQHVARLESNSLRAGDRLAERERALTSLSDELSSLQNRVSILGPEAEQFSTRVELLEAELQQQAKESEARIQALSKELAAEVRTATEAETELTDRYEARILKVSEEAAAARGSAEQSSTALEELAARFDSLTIQHNELTALLEQERLELQTRDDLLEELRSRSRAHKGAQAEWERTERELRRARADADRLAEFEAKQREQVQASMAAQEDELTRAQNLVAWLRSELATITEEREEREAEYSRLGGHSNVRFEAQIDDIEGQLTESRSRANALRKELDIERGATEARVREAFESGSKLSDRAAVLAAEQAREIEALKQRLAENEAVINDLTHRLATD